MRSKLLGRCITAALLGTLSAGVPMVSSAAGFALIDQGPHGLGEAYAGGAASAEDASTIFYNAAGITRLKKPELVIGGTLISFNADFDKTTAVDAAGQPLSGGEGGDTGKLGGVPILYFTTPINDKAYFGIGINAPFGLSTDYPTDSVMRYQATYSHVSIIDLNPTLAYQFTDHFSAGIGFNYQQMNVKLANMVDYGAVCFGNVDPITCQAIGLTPQSHDGYAEVNGDSRHAFGWNVGFLWDYDTTRVGLSYRDSITHHLNGNARFEDAPSVFTSMGLFTDSRIYADFKTPEITSLSLVHDFNKQWSMAADFTRTGWSKFQELRIQFVNPNQPDSVTTEKWKDVNRFSVGLNWRYSDDWTFRTGVAQDQSPVRDAYRTPRLPDDTRTWLAFGATWRTGADSQWDVGYSHLFINGNNIPIDQTGATGDRLVGSYKASADIFGISYRHTY